MKNAIVTFLIISLLLAVGLACNYNPLSRFTKQYHCTYQDEPEPKTSQEYFERAIKTTDPSCGTEGDCLDECAFGALNEAIRLDPNNVDALIARAFGYYQKKKYELALSDADKAIQLDPKNPNAYSIRGMIYERKELFDRAIEDITKEIEFRPSDDYVRADSYAKRGDIYIKQGSFEKAVSDYSEAIRVEPKYQSRYLAKRAEGYRKLGKNDLAVADEKKIEAIRLEGKSEAESSDNEISDLNKSSNAKTIELGELNENAIDLPEPVYSAAARAVKAKGTVSVKVLIDVKGNVVSATVVSGHPLLRSSAKQAALKAKFSPKILDGESVKVSGVIKYDF